MVNKNSVFESYKLLFDGKEEDLNKIPNSHLFVLIRWLSFSKSNIDICNILNFYYKYVKHDIIKWLLYWRLDIENKYIKFIKPEKEKELEFLKNYLKQYFSWSEKEFTYNKKIIDKLLENDNFKIGLCNVFGFSKEECKKLDIKYISHKLKRKDTNSSSLFNFVKK